MISFARLIVPAIVLGCISVAAHAQEALNLVVPQPKAFPTSQIGSNVVYGRIDYSVRFTQNNIDAKKSFQNFLRQAVTNGFGGEDGSYVVTLVVKKTGGEEIAKKAISSFTWKNKNFFFFTTESSITSEISFGGRLLDHFPVTNNNNNLQVALQIQNSKTIGLDTATYNKVSDQVSLMKFDLVQPAVEIAPLLKVPLETMRSLLDSTERATLTADTPMSFIANASSYPKQVEFPVKGPRSVGRSMNDESKMVNGLVVTVTLETEPTFLGGFQNGKFQNLDLNNVLQKATVGSSSGAVPFESMLSSDANKQVLSDLISLDQEKYPSGRSPAGICRKLWNTLQKYFTERDAPAIYTAYLDKYDYVLDVVGAKAGCVDQFRGTITNLGVPLSSVAITK
ncbi:hypothetical protein HUN27_22025 [Agrobacterium tumefaciens]|nr:hypothetical protein [Agrobacterium tumefaciens]